MTKKAFGITRRSDSDRRLRQADRLRDVLKVLELLQGNGRWDAATLASELEVSERTVYRYLQVLECAAVPWWFDRQQKSYRLAAGFRFPVLNLSPDELLGQAVTTAIASAPGLDVGPSGRAIVDKLAVTSAQDAREILDDARQLIQVLDLKLVDHRQHLETIRIMQWALLRRKQLVGQYVSPYKTKPQRITLHPYRLCLVRQAWYLIARPNKNQEPRTYRVNRFRTLRSLDAKAERPTDFDLRRYFGNAWSVFRGETSYCVRIRFTREAAVQAAETIWHHTQQVEQHRDGSATLTFEVDGLEEILWWLLQWAGFAEILEPPELKDLYRQQLDMATRLNP
jgi:predicted DNA-binding transcriptional regulator YafY